MITGEKRPRATLLSHGPHSTRVAPTYYDESQMIRIQVALVFLLCGIVLVTCGLL